MRRSIQTHRDPLRVMASMASHATVLRRAFSDSADPAQIAADWSERWARALDDFLAVRDRAPHGQFLDVNYDDLERAPVDDCRAHLRLPRLAADRHGAPAMHTILRANPKNKHGVHRYSLAQYGLTETPRSSAFATTANDSTSPSERKTDAGPAGLLQMPSFARVSVTSLNNRAKPGWSASKASIAASTRSRTES